MLTVWIPTLVVSPKGLTPDWICGLVGFWIISFLCLKGPLGGVVIVGAAASMSLPATVAVAAQSARVTTSGGLILVAAAVSA